MVVFLDLEHESEDDEPGQASDAAQHRLRISRSSDLTLPREWHNGSISVNRPHLSDPDGNAVLLASVLACFPISQSLASYLDLNDLFALSSTCHQVHDALVQFAHHLRRESLHCVNDEHPQTLDESDVQEWGADGYGDDRVEGTDTYGLGGATSNVQTAFPVHGQWSPPTYHYGNTSSVLGLRGQVRKCARDMVTPCRKCGIIVCRNCTIKPPASHCYKDRFRRLCQTCLDAPLKSHLEHFQDDGLRLDSPSASSASSTHSIRSSSDGSSASSMTFSHESEADSTFTSPALLRTPCECDTRGVYLCQPCGQNLCSTNTTYKRVWTWRSRYSTHIGGGLGTGLGQGEQGQKCGRGENCLETGAAGVCWVEIDCSESRAQLISSRDYPGYSRGNTSQTLDADSRPTRNKPGYLSQEMEGIGGVVKKKVKKRIKVGATVYEYADERESGKYLEREATGKQRSWCGWCFRVCPGQEDDGTVTSLLHTPHP